MDWLEPVDQYCERLAPGLLAEPYNALSNLGFIVAGLWLLRLATRRGWHWALSTQAVLIVLIGLGSAAFHTAAQRWAEALDVGFIALYILFYLPSWLHIVCGWRWPAALAGIPAFAIFAALVVAWFDADAFNGSVSYLPALAALWLLAAAQSVRRDPGAARLAGSGALLLVSLGLRSVDAAWCAAFPAGTHWAWHLLNAGVLSLATWALAPRHPPSR